MKIRSLTDSARQIFLFVGLLYAFVPFEAGNYLITNAIHITALMLISMYTLYVGRFKLKMNQLGKIVLILLMVFTMISSMVSYGKGEVIFAFSIIFSFITASVIHYNNNFKHQFLIALKWLIIFSISMLFLQLIVLNITGDVLSIHEMIFPFSEARISINTKFDDLYRMGGIYIEPGTYSNLMYLFLVIYMLLSKNLSNYLLFIGAISIILSYSVWGMIFGSYLLFFLIFIKLKNSSLKMKLLVLIAVFSIGSLSINYIINSPAVNYATYKVNSDVSSVSEKEKAYSRYKESIDDFFIIGEGFSPEFNVGIASVQDSGFLLNFSVVFGILFTVYILMVYILSFLKCCTPIQLIISLPIFVSKIYYWDAAFWLLFFLVVYGGYTKHKKIKCIYGVDHENSTY